MKQIQLILVLIVSSIIYAQEVTFNVSDTYVDQLGKNSDATGFTPLFKLDSDVIHNQQKSAKIKRFPKAINKSKTAYAFLYFKGVKSSLFKDELVLLIENYESKNPTIYIDRNGNLDFTDDESPINLNGNIILKLKNSDDNSAIYHYNISKSKILEKYESRVRNRYAPRFPKSSIISTTNWIADRPHFVRVSKETLNGKPITIFLLDTSADGLFTFQTESYGDRILIVEGEIDINNDMTSLFRQAEPIDHNAVFELYGKKYYIKNVSKNGNSLTIAETDKKPKVVFKEGQDISSFSIKLLDGSSTTVKDLIKENKHLIIDVGGTWCGGCITQEPTIKKIYDSGKAKVIGLFDHDTPKSVGRYIKKHNLKWPVALVSPEFKKMFRVISYPTYIIVSPKGKIVLADRNSEKIKEFLNK